MEKGVQQRLPGTRSELGTASSSLLCLLPNASTLCAVGACREDVSPHLHPRIMSPGEGFSASRVHLKRSRVTLASGWEDRALGACP